MAVVKNRLKVFEAAPDQETMAGTRPQTALKPSSVFGQNMTPALEKFMKKQNEVIGAGSSSANSEAWPKKTPNVPSKAAASAVASGADQDENNTPVTSINKSVVVRPAGGATKPADSRRGSQVVVPSIFKQEPVNATTTSESRRGSQVGVPEVLKHSSKNTSSESSASDENKPKPPAKPGSAYPRPPAGPKPPVTGSLKPALSASSGYTAQSVMKKPSDVKAEEKPQHSFQRDSGKVKLPAMDHVSLKPTQPGATASQSASQAATSEVKDFRNILKPASQAAGKPKPAALKALLPPTSSDSSKVTDTEKDSTSQQDRQALDDSSDSQLGECAAEEAAPQTEPRGNKWKPVSQELKRLSTSPVIERKNDCKQFKKLKFEAAAASTSPPPKPALPGNIDLALVTQQYHQILNKTSEVTNGSHVADADGDVYDDGSSVADVVRRESSTKRQSTCISMIPDMTAEEEELELYDDGLTPAPAAQARLSEADGLYVDAETERKSTQDDEVYEDEEAFAVSTEKVEEDRKRRQKEEAEAKKREEKERKEEEKKRKKEEKEKAKKEKEEMQLRKKFNLTGDETVAGEGVIKQDVKGGVLFGLSLKKGQTVTIIRLDNNPPNKWLIRSDAGMGYIDSSIIEVDPNIIRQAMTGHARAQSLRDGDDEQPVYDDVPPDGQSHDAEDFEEIYEECP